MITQDYNSNEPMFLEDIGILINVLMREFGHPNWDKKFSDSVDGILFLKEQKQENYFIGHGKAYILAIDSTDYVEPVSIELHFGATSRKIKEARLKFGMTNSLKPEIGSSDADNISISAVQKAERKAPFIEFDWRYDLIFSDNEWKRTTQ